MLEASGINAAYGRVQVLFGLSFTVEAGEVHCLMGRNGAGKSTALKTIMGHLPLLSGSIRLDGQEISQVPAHEIPLRGGGLIPQGRRLFSELTVEENLQIGLMARGRSGRQRDDVLDIFPRLRERLSQPAATLSGGEQQMLAVARALCLDPKLLLLDEPTEGLQPSMIEQIQQVILRLRNEGVAILLVEQRVDAVLSIADRISFIENGRMTGTGTVDELRSDRQGFSALLGV
ncbi:MAG: ABC transporter ATP-binding protein [Rhodobacteraceae bacterium]|nr:ABC transporter ATP-binding protein [Paracoccaceae bacterium]